MPRDPFVDVTTDLTPSERLALVYIRINGPIKQAELYRTRRMSDGSMVHAINGLLDAGHIVRESCLDKDRNRASPWVYDPDWHDSPVLG